MIKAAVDPLWVQVNWLKAGKKTDSIRINSLIAKDVVLTNEINLLKTNYAALKKQFDSIPFVLIDTTKYAGKVSLDFKNGTLKIYQ